MSNQRIVKWAELLDHTEVKSIWILIDGKVYDVTTYLAEHPGGDDILFDNVAHDATQAFKNAGHSDYAVSLREPRLVGVIESSPPSQEVKHQLEEKRKLIKLSKTVYTWEELGKHNKSEDLYVVISGKVYDLTKFQAKHPGGPQILLKYAGHDASAAFEQVGHSENAKNLMRQFQVGQSITKNPPKEKENLKPLVGVATILLLLAVWLFLKK